MAEDALRRPGRPSAGRADGRSVTASAVWQRARQNLIQILPKHKERLPSRSPPRRNTHTTNRAS